MKHIITGILLLVVTVSFSQIKFQGTIKDSIGDPLELANIVAINKVTNKMDSYAISNDKGRYKLDLEENTPYNIKVSYIGMRSVDITIETKAENIDKAFTLVEDNNLDQVELTYEMPVTISGDTLIYNADSFKNGTERKLEDVMKKLPGVEINDDGQIEVEGKVVGKVMVEGKDFFDGDSKLALKNIPANAVDKVQVLKNYSEVGQLSGVKNNQDNIAINIKLKEGKKNFWFGTVTAGTGIADSDGLYLAQPKLFYYSPDYSINVIGDINNIGEVAFSRRDYFNFSGGFKSPSQSSGTNLNLGGNSLGFLQLQNNRAKDINTKFGASNFSVSPNKALDIGGFGIFSSSRIDLQENNSRIFTDQTLGIPNENTESLTHQKSDLGMLKLNTSYKPNGNNQLDYEILGRMSNETQTQNVASSVIGNIEEIESSTPFSINQNLDYYYTLNEKNIFALNAQHLISDEDPFYNAFLEDKLNYDSTADALGLDKFQVGYDLGQQKRVRSNQLDAKLDYWNILNKKSDINLTFGTILSRQDFDTNIFQTLDNGSIINPTPIINNGLSTNNTTYNFSDLYLGFHYRLKAGIFTFTPGFSAHTFSLGTKQFGQDYSQTFTRLLPDVNVRMQLKNSEQIIFNYRVQNQFTDVSQFAQGLVLNNYNSLSSGNPLLENSLSHNLNLSYFSFNMFNYTNVFANLNYTRSIDNIRNESQFEPGSVVNVSAPFNSNFSDESMSANGRFQRTFGKLKATVNGTFSYTKFNQIINSNVSVNENYAQNYRFGFSSNFRTAPNFNIGYRYNIQDNDQGSSRTKFYTHAPSVEFDALIFKSFTFKTDYTFNDFRNETASLNTFEFWNASLAYRKDEDSKWEFELKATNLLNTTSQNQSSVSNLSVSATEYFIQPRFLTIRAIYNL
jgi:hypothetical protein